jgi:hypothetical protein
MGRPPYVIQSAAIPVPSQMNSTLVLDRRVFLAALKMTAAHESAGGNPLAERLPGVFTLRSE